MAFVVSIILIFMVNSYKIYSDAINQNVKALNEFYYNRRSFMKIKKVFIISFVRGFGNDRCAAISCGGRTGRHRK